tara:strand:+ start:1300 stop:1845 length:546 start_codon:yes stop_codon:yes gene_type:complete
MSLNPKIINHLTEWHGCRARILVETGTFEGRTVKQVHSFFEEIHTIEASLKAQRRAKGRCRDLTNVTFYLGDSATALQKVVNGIDEPIWFFLDAHYFEHPDKQNIISEQNHMPLMDELKIIQKRKHKDLVIIHDFHWLNYQLNIDRGASSDDVLELMKPAAHIVFKDCLVFPTNCPQTKFL